MVPTKERNHPSFYLKYDKDGLLFDCGEGIQRQMKTFGIKLTNVTKILLTHWHGDHVLGLPGLLQSIYSIEKDKKIIIYGPKESKKYFKSLMEGMATREVLNVEIKEVEDKTFFENEKFKLLTKKVNHGVNCNAYSFIEKDRRRINLAKIKKIGIPEGPILGKLQKGQNIMFKGKKINADEVTTIIKGKKITYITDTKLVKNCYELAENSDLLICESTYLSDMADQANERLHMTAQEAAQIASTSNVKKLILTHFSARYKSCSEIEEEARTVFDNTKCAYDGMKVKI